MSDSDPEGATDAAGPIHLNLLLIDGSDADRDQLYRILSSVITDAGAIHQAATLEGAWEIAASLDHLEALVGGIPSSGGDALFDLRDRLHARFGPVAAAFCSREDMSPYFDRVIEGEMLFYKPVNDEVMRDWLSQRTGMQLRARRPEAAEAAPPAVESDLPLEPGDDAIGPEGEEDTLPEPAGTAESDASLADGIAEGGSGGDLAGPGPEVPSVPEGGGEIPAAGEDPAESAATTGPEEAEPPPGPGDALPEGLLRVGTQLGDYELLSIIQHDEDLAMYEAQQISIGRRVALKTLYRRHRTDPNWVGTFAHEARSRALVSHPNISLVYEADQDRGVTYYTLELIDGPTLAQLAAAGTALDDATLWRTLKVVADVLHYLKQNRMEHRMLSADTIFLVGDGQPRIANPVKPGVPMPEEDSAQMRLIAEAVRPFVRGNNRADKRLVALLDRMSNPARVDGVKSGHGLSEAIRHLEDQALHPPPRRRSKSAATAPPSSPASSSDC